MTQSQTKLGSFWAFARQRGLAANHQPVDVEKRPPIQKNSFLRLDNTEHYTNDFQGIHDEAKNPDTAEPTQPRTG
jgi:hypothetical protein